MYYVHTDTVAGPEFWKGEVNKSAPSSFIVNVNNELYAFYPGKGGLLKNPSR